MDIQKIVKFIAEKLAVDEILIQQLVTKPKEKSFGDYALPVFQLAKGQNPVEFAKSCATKLEGSSVISKAKAVGPYVNFFLDQSKVAQDVLTHIHTRKDTYGSQIQETPQTFVIDYSAPNIAKPFGIGHLRSTVIGNTIKNLLSFLGHNVVGLNYIGDWGTQFGKVIYAYKTWGNREELQKDPVAYLLDLYVRFHEEATTNDSLNDEARKIFSELEDRNKEYLALWEEFRKLSLDKFDETYDLLQVSFDEVRGEAYYNDKMQPIISQLEEKNLLKESEGAKIIDFADFDIKLPPIIIVKSNGASTYALRDITSAIDRVNSFGADYLLYEVGAEQKLHFQQVIATLKLLGYEWADKITHIDHGFYRFKDQKFSTRKGNIILMEDVLNQSVQKVREIIQEKNPVLAESDEFELTAKAIGVGAIVFFDMKNDRVKDVNFEWDAVLDFQGESGPYIQYTHARICSILDKQKPVFDSVDFTKLNAVEDRFLLNHLSEFGDIVQNSVQNYKPHIIARYVYDLAQMFNDYYQKHKVLTDDESITNARLVLIESVGQVLRNGLELLGIQAPRRM